MSSLDSSQVLNRLIQTGIWSNQDFLSRYKRVAVDVDSISAFFYRLCLSTHLRKQSLSLATNQQINLYSATLINFRQYSAHINQLVDFFVSSNIEPIFVYEGKSVEAPIFGLVASNFETNSKKVAQSISCLKNYDKHNTWTCGNILDHVSPPNLALNIFKSIINARRRAGASIGVQQAYYSAIPVLVLIARNFRCPVISNRPELIMMDIRAGFILIDEFWNKYVDIESTQTNSRLRSLGPKPKSPVTGHAVANRSKSSSNTHLKCNFHFNRSFLRQHPGLNPALALSLFPLNTIDFMVKHAKSLKSVSIYKEEYKEGDFYPNSITGKASSASVAYSHHHASANRLDMLLNFLCSKTVTIIGNLVRGVATKTNSSFDVDFRQIYNYYAVAYEFKHRLRFILSYLDDDIQLNYIEWTLINRECTADYLLSMLCCSIGRLASINYNNSLQFEDLQTKNSAYSLANRGKAMLMSLFSSNKSHKGEHSASSKHNPETITRYSTASLTIIDREYAKIVEKTISTTHEDSELDSIRDRLDMSKLTSRKISTEDSITFINLVFKSKGLTKLDQRIETILTKHIGSDKDTFKDELAIILSILDSTISTASQDDLYFKKTYLALCYHFRIALLNQHLFISHEIAKKKQQNELSLINLIKEHDWENVALPTSTTERTRSPKSNSKSPGNQKSQKSKDSRGRSISHDSIINKHIRHLIELLNSGLEIYYEMNAFFNYPLPKLNLHMYMNSILIFNLTRYSYEQANSNHGKSLITF